ncbi:MULTISPECIES: GH1 family beta-glucosidase [Methylococcus]|jgi:beta-glucosidase|uniref:Beta-glucosidase n=1 Tax=Methylococcus capsulatus (strain ATCC 33009 / NCIMB 11132 / Bath) TaxID=243233 RepID=Q608B9_METCA|nr:GH1 family beta-glucosidase [Methylococcus capsulatus]AAU92142.1 beta-glucosidase [Methylococcus capsulatus str. Bath]QXP87743.1 beta-glucosidase [Methylococcus capsulatus]QXP92517.1 beta-glucosidase [Methylococcus capsulatus]UQN12758.1 GH1 family beta-glucosidase [Methylococcus capsulatus]
MSRYEFPERFLWGAATSAYQVEGSPLADGAGPSNWHRFCRQPGRILNGDTGDTACDHYRRFREDVALMKALGLSAYRFSIAWSRIFPEGKGRINWRGIAHYQALVETLLEHGIRPMATLHHWDLPAALEDLGGWANRDSAGWFADYAHTVIRALGNEIDLWATLNEPWVIMDAGYVSGVHPPGHRSLKDAPWVTHNLLRAHALAVQAFRADGRGQIGLVVNLEPKYALTDSRDDRAAAERAHAYMNRQYLDPVLHGAYPDELAEISALHWPSFESEDLRVIQEPIDYLGINYYTRAVVRHDPSGGPLEVTAVPQRGVEHTEMGWEVYPQGLKDVLAWVKARYGDIPLYITENGAAFADPEGENGRIDDTRRIAYYRSHLRALHEAIAQGVDVRGYFAWSLLDNFEWTYGYARRFGLVQVDPLTQRRIPKASAGFYAEVAQTNGAVLDRDY